MRYSFVAPHYQDASGAGQMTTASLALWNGLGTQARLVGVLGVDLLVAHLTAAGGDYQSLLGQFVARSFSCFGTNVSACEREALRRQAVSGDDGLYASANVTCDPALAAACPPPPPLQMCSAYPAPTEFCWAGSSRPADLDCCTAACPGPRSEPRLLF